MSTTSGPRLHIVPVDWNEASTFVDATHRHHKAPTGHKFSIGVIDIAADRIVGVAIVGRPVARYFQDRFTFEVTRVATNGTPNACSALYRAAWRSAKERGIRRMVTYTQQGESGASLRGAGWVRLAERRPNTGWDRPGRPRQLLGTENIARTLWQLATHDAPEIDVDALLQSLRYETRYETGARSGPRACPECRGPIPVAPTGRPAQYCGHACKQRAYRRRQRTPA
jgi:hypothetical protein